MALVYFCTLTRFPKPPPSSPLPRSPFPITHCRSTYQSVGGGVGTLWYQSRCCWAAKEANVVFSKVVVAWAGGGEGGQGTAGQGLERMSSFQTSSLLEQVVAREARDCWATKGTNVVFLKVVAAWAGGGEGGQGPAGQGLEQVSAHQIRHLPV